MKVHMRQVFADFMRLSNRPELGIGLSIPLGREDVNTDLASLQDGVPVLLIEPGELQATGTAKLIERNGFRYWYGLLASREDIQPNALTAEDEAIFEEEFEDGLPGMRYLQDR